jgi:hypothetical protein
MKKLDSSNPVYPLSPKDALTLTKANLTEQKPDLFWYSFFMGQGQERIGNIRA